MKSEKIRSSPLTSYLIWNVNFFLNFPEEESEEEDEDGDDDGRTDEDDEDCEEEEGTKKHFSYASILYFRSNKLMMIFENFQKMILFLYCEVLV